MGAERPHVEAQRMLPIVEMNIRRTFPPRSDELAVIMTTEQTEWDESEGQTQGELH
jgi:hypothetical protein